MSRDAGRASDYAVARRGLHTTPGHPKSSTTPPPTDYVVDVDGNCFPFDRDRGSGIAVTSVRHQRRGQPTWWFAAVTPPKRDKSTADPPQHVLHMDTLVALRGVRADRPSRPLNFLGLRRDLGSDKKAHARCSRLPGRPFKRVDETPIIKIGPDTTQTQATSVAFAHAYHGSAQPKNALTRKDHALQHGFGPSDTRGATVPHCPIRSRRTAPDVNPGRTAAQAGHRPHRVDPRHRRRTTGRR